METKEQAQGQFINQITRFVDLRGFEDEIKRGKGLKIVVHGPRREYLQVIVTDIQRQPLANRPSSEPESQG